MPIVCHCCHAPLQANQQKLRLETKQRAARKAAELLRWQPDSGRAIADPFEPTAGLVDLLELRRSQIAAAQGGASQTSGRLRALLRGRLHHARA